MAVEVTRAATGEPTTTTLQAMNKLVAGSCDVHELAFLAVTRPVMDR